MDMYKFENTIFNIRMYIGLVIGFFGGIVLAFNNYNTEFWISAIIFFIELAFICGILNVLLEIIFKKEHNIITLIRIFIAMFLIFLLQIAISGIIGMVIGSFLAGNGPSGGVRTQTRYYYVWKTLK